MKITERTSKDGYKQAVYYWDEVKEPKGIIQIAHGMNEHMARYDWAAREFNKAGYIVAGGDHPAHGRTAGSRDKVGLAQGLDVYNLAVSNMRELSEELIQKYNLPLVLLGHSYGSYLSQTYFMRHSLIEGVKGIILSGSGLVDGASLTLGKTVCSLNKEDKPANFIKGLTFGAYDKKIKDGKNGWLTRDKAIVEAYNADEFIVDVFSYGFYKYFFRGLGEIFAKPSCEPKELSIFFASGSMCGVGGYGKTIQKLYDKYIKLGFTNAKFKLYPDCRHELLNELNRGEVIGDMTAFADGVIHSRPTR